MNKKDMNDIEKILNNNRDRFSNVEIQQEESNTDKFLKKKIIEILNENDVNTGLYDKNIHKKCRVKPDLVLKIANEFNYFEIKTSKKDNGVLPGSSIQQVDLLEPTIFWNRETNSFKVDYYYTFLTGDLPFPDRSPRPTIRFKGNDITYDEATSLISDWKEHLAEVWITSLKSKNTKWFDEAIDYFVLKLIELPQEEREVLKSIILDRIKENNK